MNNFNSQTINHFVLLPKPIFNLILDHLTLKDWANLERTSKEMQKFMDCIQLPSFIYLISLFNFPFLFSFLILFKFSIFFPKKIK